MQPKGFGKGYKGKGQWHSSGGKGLYNFDDAYVPRGEDDWGHEAFGVFEEEAPPTKPPIVTTASTRNRFNALAAEDDDGDDDDIMNKEVPELTKI